MCSASAPSSSKRLAEVKNIWKNLKLSSDPAPERPDINWVKLGVGHYSRLARSVLINVMTFLLVFFWMIPVTFVSGLCNLGTLSSLKVLYCELLLISDI